jgi:hypothetical protein
MVTATWTADLSPVSLLPHIPYPFAELLCHYTPTQRNLALIVLKSQMFRKEVLKKISVFRILVEKRL